MWIQSIMSKAGGSRRRPQSKSPTSDGSSSSNRKRSFFKGKKRRSSFSKDRTYTEEESFHSDTSSMAAWRVENIRDRAPTEQDWWNDSKDGEAGAGGNHNDKSSSKGVVASIIQPQSSASAFMIVDGKERKFHNCGLETWEQARKEWKKRTVDVIPPKPEPPKKHELAKGLAKASNVRTFELPRKMALPDLINTYQQVWNLPDGGR